MHWPKAAPEYHKFLVQIQQAIKQDDII